MIGDLIIFEGNRYAVTSQECVIDYNGTSVQLECKPVRPDQLFGLTTRGKGKSYMAFKDAFEVEKVIYNDPATIVFWADGTKTVVKCQRFDVYDPQVGFLMCIAKKAYGNNGKFNDVIREHVLENPAIKAVRDFVKSIFG